MLKKLSYIFLISCLFVLPGKSVLAEGSMYSLKGQGILYYFPGGRATAMGGATIAVASPINLNWINPAALSVQDHVRLCSQFLYQNLDIYNGSEHYLTNYANFNGVYSALSIYPGIGLGFGLQPISKINYQFESQNEVADYNYTSIAKGSGGLNRLFFSTGIKLHPHFRLGATMDFVFGKVDEDWRINYHDGEFINTFNQYRSKYWGLDLNLGVIAIVVPGWNIGAIYNTGHTLNRRLDKSFKKAGLSESFHSELDIPSKWGVGTSVRFKNRYMLALDYFYQDWSAYSNKTASKSSEEFTQFQRLGFGFEYGLPIRMNTPFLKRLRYRLGSAWRQSYLTDYNGEKINTFILTAGIGIPYASGSGTIDIDLEYGKRGDISKNTFEETILRLCLYVSGGELWFQR